MATADDYRLPTNVHPTEYSVAIKTDLTSSPPSFAGEAIVDLTATENTESLVFHCHPSLTITDVVLAATDGANAVVIPASTLTLDEDTQRATVDIKSTGGLKAGAKARLFLRFHAELSGNMMGYYKSNGDPDENGKRPIYALTQMAPTAARKAFPCWDEPLLKASFAISMIARDGETVLSNMPAVSTKPWKPTASDTVLAAHYPLGSGIATDSGTGWSITEFETTPPMSTYLVAYACGDFAHLSDTYTSVLTGKEIALKVYATPNQIAKGKLALDVMKWGLPVYEKLFDIPYPLPKLDTLVAHDFDAGAMENWGLITGRTTAYMCDDRSSLAARKRTVTVQLHEIAHQWFGNVVTPAWWDNIWLNEAFATLMGTVVGPEHTFPEWKMTREFLDVKYTAALNLDCRRSSHAVEVDCPDSSQINEIFDAISYSKGASILRMLKGVVGDDKFFKGVSVYLKKHLYGNAVTKDLWEGISQAAGADVSARMENWTRKIGFPVISVEEESGGGGAVKLTQNRFLATGDVQPQEDDTLWWVPLEIKTVGADGTVKVDHDAVMTERSTTYKPAFNTFKLNADTIGLYRVKYSPERLAKLGTHAQSFSVEDRFGLLSDATALAKSGHSTTSGALAFAVRVGADETEYLAFSQISALLSKVASVWWEDDAVRAAVDKVRVHVFRPVVDRLGYEHAPNDAPEVQELRELAVSVAAKAGDADVLAEVKRRFAPLLASGDYSLIPPDLQRTIFTQSVRHGGVAEYEKVLAVYNDPPNPSTKVDAMLALGSVQSKDLADRTFAMVSDPAAIKDQDLPTFFTGLGGNTTLRHRTAEYFMSHWPQFNARYDGSFGMRGVINGALASLSSKADYERVAGFFKENEASARKYKLVVAQVLEGIKANSDWLARSDEDVRWWLKENEYVM